MYRAQSHCVQQIKSALIHRHSSNTLTRCQAMGNCIRQATSEILKQLGFDNISYDEYKIPISTVEQAEQYVKWINGLSPTSQPRKTKNDSDDDIEIQLRRRCNFLLAERFGDELFPFLFRHCFDYAQYIAYQIFDKNNVDLQLQRNQFLSILKKAYFLKTLHFTIKEFKQAKPAPLICKRSLCIKPRELTRFLKQEFGENKIKDMLKKKMIKVDYEKFPNDLEMANDVITELWKEEINYFIFQYGSNNNDYKISFNNTNPPDTMQNINQSINYDEDDDTSFMNQKLEHNNTDNVPNSNGEQDFRKPGNFSLQGPLPSDDHVSSINSNYFGIHDSNFTWSPQRYDPMYCPCQVLKQCQVVVRYLQETMKLFEQLMPFEQNNFSNDDNNINYNNNSRMSNETNFHH